MPVNCEKNDVILYSTGCPKCEILESKLKISKITYDVVKDKNEMIKNGFKNVPVLKVNNEFLDYYEANNLIWKVKYDEIPSLV